MFSVVVVPAILQALQYPHLLFRLMDDTLSPSSYLGIQYKAVPQNNRKRERRG